MDDAWESMTSFNEASSTRMMEYCQKHGLTIVDTAVGSGNDGTLILTDQQSVVKVFFQPNTIAKELEVYRRLGAQQLSAILGHAVPQLLGYDISLGVLEMTFVTRPFVLDFGKVRLDQPLESYWPEEVMAERWEYWESLFEPEQWPKVLAIHQALGRGYGIWLEDLHLGNIGFGDQSDLS